MIEIYTGKPGSGKSLRLARKFLDLRDRNIRYFRKTGVVRRIMSNLRFAPELERDYSDFIQYWSDPAELVQARDVDILWDEISVHLDASQWANVPLDLKKFLRQHRKRGVDIFGTSQNFASVDISMRRLVDSVYECYKIVGSGNPAPTKPPIKHIWGFIWMAQLDPMTFDDAKPRRIGYDWLFISRELVSIYDTTQEISMGKYPPLNHIERECLDPDCDFHKVIHI